MTDTAGSRWFSSKLVWAVLAAIPPLCWLGNGLLWFLWLCFPITMMIHHAALKSKLGRRPTAGPCQECGAAVGLFWRSEQAWALAPLAGQGDRRAVLAGRVCATCVRGVRRWRCEDCAEESSAPAVRKAGAWKAPACPHCSGAVVRLLPVPDEMVGQPEQVRAWLGGARQATKQSSADDAKRIASLIADREGRQAEYLGGVAGLAPKLPVFIYATREGLVVVRRSDMGKLTPDPACAAVIPWGEVSDIRSDTFREGSDATKINAWMTAMNPRTGGVGAAVGALSLFVPGEHTVHLLVIVRRVAGVDAQVVFKVRDGAAMASGLSADRARFAAIAERQGQP